MFQDPFSVNENLIKIYRQKLESNAKLRKHRKGVKIMGDFTWPMFSINPNRRVMPLNITEQKYSKGYAVTFSY